MDPTIITTLLGSGHAGLLPWIALFVAGCSAADALLPQPAPTSHWLPLRKVLSLAAWNAGHAANASQPNLDQWALATLQKLAAQPTPLGQQAAAILIPPAAPGAGGQGDTPPDPTHPKGAM